MKHGDIKKINTLSLQESENLWQGLINSKLFAPLNIGPIIILAYEYVPQHLDSSSYLHPF